MKRDFLLRLILLATFAMVAVTNTAFALHKPGHKAGEGWKAHLLAELPLADPPPNVANSDIAFWGNKAFVGNYRGFRIFDISG